MISFYDEQQTMTNEEKTKSGVFRLRVILIRKEDCDNFFVDKTGETYVHDEWRTPEHCKFMLIRIVLYIDIDYNKERNSFWIR